MPTIGDVHGTEVAARDVGLVVTKRIGVVAVLKKGGFHAGGEQKRKTKVNGVVGESVARAVAEKEVVKRRASDGNEVTVCL
jgi:hypothetical protein